MANPKLGEEVYVPWGLDVLPGIVLRIYEASGGPRVVVRVEVPGVSGASVDSVDVTLPLDSLNAPSNPPPPPGDWVNAQAYERSVFGALVSLTATFPEGDVSVAEGRADSGYDFLVSRNDGRTIAIEVKYFMPRSRVSRSALNRIARFAEMSLVPVVVIANMAPSGAAHQMLEGGVRWIRWRGSRDNAEMVNSLRAAFAT